MSISTSSDKKIELIIPMLPDIEVTAINTAEAVAEYMKFETDKIDELKMALIEACINAFEHSKSNERKLYLNFIMNDNDLTVIIKDSGKGFDLNKVEKPDINKKMKASYKRGWGLMLIENLVDEFKIDTDASGTTIVITKLKN